MFKLIGNMEVSHVLKTSIILQLITGPIRIMGAIIFVTVLLVTMPIWLFNPTSPDDLNINQLLDEININQSLDDHNINQSPDDLNINQSPDDLNINKSLDVLNINQSPDDDLSINQSLDKLNINQSPDDLNRNNLLWPKVSTWEQTKSDDCWSDCGKKGGPCPSFCGSNGYCCRKGYDGCPPGAGKASPNHHTCVREIEYRWRDDGRCGVNYPLSNDKPGQCDPKENAKEKGPCCSKDGYCGNTDADCKCSTCVNYTEVDVICSDLVVSHADYGNCNGAYRVVGLKVEWDTSKPVYKQINGDKYIFWNTRGWSIGKKEALISGGWLHSSNLHTKEPWQGVWIPEAVKVKCIEITDFINGKCYSGDDPVSQILHDSHYHDFPTTNSPKKCKKACQSTGFLYAGVEYGERCWCTNDRPPAFDIQDSSQCNMDCPGDDSQKCGGPSRFTIYRTDDDVICPDLVVSHANYAKCNGEYGLVDVKVEWAPSRPVYKIVNRNRYIFWNKGEGWSMGNKLALTTGLGYHISGLDTKEPWQGLWEKGAKVECKENSAPELLHVGRQSQGVRYKYYKVPVKTGSVLLASVVKETCELHEMHPQCYGSSERYADSNCKSAPEADFPADQLAELICGARWNTPVLCRPLEQTFWYVRGLFAGSAWGVRNDNGGSNGEFVLGVNITSSRKNQYFAACLHLEDSFRFITDDK